ncbi:LysM peptidoglycan-binding domain-containing protein [Neobacillus sp. PS2-9]|uniref:C40 family peptidase n=1 Tax=Neobacillus sp. PS2-9 TaxID=3070676 RepID=UPI0027DEAF7D|nr:LysM peptidoglycan-binding domain-containing protein [Neobacillus sp. PS2-9]WML58580.1 LysM peptidoglycan-binding domain-containing protein [Neobacillus sp. PS2-9]
MKKTIVRTLSTAALFSTLFAGSALADTYQVQKGDSLSKIASKYHTSVSGLKTLNGLKSDMIYVNQMLKVSNEPISVQAPKTTTYTVVSGDALIKIANRYNVTVGELKQWNNLDNTIIYVGQVLKVSAPGTGTVSVPKPAPTQTPKEAPTSAPKSAPAPATQGATNMYTIKSGDSLSKIGVQFKMSVTQLKTLNNLKSDMIYVGQKLKVNGTVSTPSQPPATTPPVVAQPSTTSEYVIKSGDTLGKIAIQTGMSVQDLKSLNGLTSDMIYVGQKLKVNGGKVSSAPAPAPSSDFATNMVNTAKSLMGIKYVWGGSSLSGFDCSGFIYYVANKAGKQIGRYSAEGFYSRAYYVDQPKAGDLVFFENTYKKGISHVGIYLGGDQFIHADEAHGIMISTLKSPYYTTHLDGFKRFY